MTTLRVAVIGHSYVRRLGEFVTRNKSFNNLRLDQRRFEVQFFGIGGSSTCGRRRYFQADTDYRRLSTMDIVYIHLGENDFRNGVDPTKVAEELFCSACRLINQHHVSTVIISELLPFPKCMNRKWVRQVNNRLHDLVNRCHNVRVWKQKKCFWSERSDYMYHWDGIHVNPSRMHVYAQGVRFAVMSASHN